MAARRSLADDLRQRSDEALAAILTSRPDLLQPPLPADVAGLAHRAGSPSSVQACLRGYDQLTLHVALAAAMGPDTFGVADLVDAVAERLPSPDGSRTVHAAAARLQADALVWGEDRSLHLVGAARDALVPADRGPRLAALDPVIAGFVSDPGRLSALMDVAPPGARAMVDRLLPGPVLGTVSDARRSPDPHRGPVDWLLVHHLLRPVGNDHVVLPAEVVAILRGHPTDDLQPVRLVPPEPATAPGDLERADRGAVGAVLDHLHRTELVCRAWATDPPTRLRTGGVSQRDLVAASRALGCPPEVARLVIEVAGAAGLLAGDVDDKAVFRPTRAFDDWVTQPAADRHAHLLVAWRDMPRGGAGNRPLEPAAAGDQSAVVLRADVLSVLSRTFAPPTPDDVLAALDWWAPRRRLPERPVWTTDTLAQAATLGIVVAGLLTSAGRALAADDGAAVRDALAAHLPPVVDQLIMQADLTAVVPGLPTTALADLLRSAADQESAGAAAVHRFSTASVHRALAAGLSGEDLLAELSARGPVPQALEYLIRDAARHHAPLHVGAAGSFVRCTDPAALASLQAEAPALALVRLSDTVMASPHPPEVVLDQLRSLGHRPVADLGVAGATEPARRTAGPAVEGRVPRVTPALADAVVRAMRAAERRGRPGGPDRRDTVPTHPVPAQEPADVVTALQTAIASRSAVLVGYVDPMGSAVARRIEPLTLSAGYLTAMDLGTEQVHSFAVARITGVAAG